MSDMHFDPGEVPQHLRGHPLCALRHRQVRGADTWCEEMTLVSTTTPRRHRHSPIPPMNDGHLDRAGRQAPAHLPLQGFQRGLRLHDARGADRREDGPSSRVDQRVQHRAHRA